MVALLTTSDYNPGLIVEHGDTIHDVLAAERFGTSTIIIESRPTVPATFESRKIN